MFVLKSASGTQAERIVASAILVHAMHVGGRLYTR